MKNNSKKKNMNAAEAAVEAYRQGAPMTDPMGMYTGLAKVGDGSISHGHYNSPDEHRTLLPEDERPTQDADDL